MDSESNYLYLYNLNRLISENPDASQRDVSKAFNVSLGMTNAILKRFAETGYILMHKISAKNIRYVLTPKGMDALTKRSYRYIKKTMHAVASYKDRIQRVVSDAKKSGCLQVVLAGESEIAFIIEYAANAEQVPFVHIKGDAASLSGLGDSCARLVFFSESAFLDETQILLQKTHTVCVDLMQIFDGEES